MAITSKALDLHFSRVATTYDANAQVPRRAAARLGEILHETMPLLPEGPILEIGCGTGLTTRHVLAAAGDREFHITDISNEMLGQCARNLQAEIGGRDIRLERLDANQLDLKKRFAAVVCSFALQWLKPDSTLPAIMDSLVPGGCLFLSVPTSQSFPEWKEICGHTGVAFSGNVLPAVDELSELLMPGAQSLTIEQMQSHHASALCFFKELRRIGADFRLHNAGSNLLKVVRAWDRRSPGGVVSTYEVCYGTIKSPDQREEANGLS